MKRWIVFGLVSLAVVVLISPGIVGKLAERSLENSISWAEHENEGLVVTEENFRRGWFTAEGRHRIGLREGFRQGRDDGPGETLALIIETRIDHGLVPVSSMSRDAGSLQPALASTISTLSLDLGEGRIVELPGALYSRFGLTGGTVSRYELEEGSFRDEDGDLRWRGADVRFRLDAAASSMDYQGRIEPVRWAGNGTTAGLGAIEFDGEQRKTGYGFSTGRLKLQMSDVSVEKPAGGRFGFGQLSLEADSRLADARVDATSSLGVDGLLVPGFGAVDLDLDIAIQRLDAAAVQRIRDTFDAAREMTPSGDFGAIYPLIERDLKGLLGAGGALRVTRFALSLPQGDVTAVMQLDLPETGPGAALSWGSLLLGLEASADVRLPAALVEMARETNPQAGTLIAMGILKRDGDAYVVKAGYAKGLVTVNGAPMALPLPASGAGEPGFIN